MMWPIFFSVNEESNTLKRPYRLHCLDRKGTALPEVFGHGYITCVLMLLQQFLVKFAKQFLF